MILRTNHDSQAPHPNSSTVRFLQETMQHRQMLEHAPVGIVQLEFSGAIRYANPFLSTLVGRSQHELLKCSLQQLIDATEPNDTWSFLDQMYNGTLRHHSNEYHLLHTSGRPIWCLITFAVVLNTAAKPDYVVAIVQETTQRRELEQRLHTRIQRLHTLIKQADTILGIVSRNGQIRFISDSIERTLGYTPQHVLGTNILEYIHRDDIAKLEATIDDYLPLTTQTVPLNVVCRVRGAHGWHHLEVMITNLLNDPDVNGIVVNCADITEQQERNEELQRQAFHDPLTSLPNRAFFLQQLEQTLEEQHPHCIGVLFLDLDKFKPVNDTLGHAVGDELLIQVARRLRASIRPQDLVARLGGDEFTILLREIQGEHHAIQVAQRVIKALTQTFRVSGHVIRIGTSIGIALTNTVDTTAEEVLHNADMAMYRAKAFGRGQYVMYRDDIDGDGSQHLRLPPNPASSESRTKQMLVGVAALGLVAAQAFRKRWRS